MVINGKPLKEFGGMILRQYSVQDCPVQNVYYKGKNRTSYEWLEGIIGLKTVSLDIVFFGSDRHDVLLRKSTLAGALYGKTELFLPDGFFYTSMYKNVSAIEWIGDQGAKATYTFEAQQHDAFTEVTGGTIFCRSTIPATDCILTATVSAVGSDGYTLGPGVFTGVQAGDVITFDGINKRILVNGADSALNCNFIHFPTLAPGQNTIECIDEVTVGYFPTYM